MVEKVSVGLQTNLEKAVFPKRQKRIPGFRGDAFQESDQLEAEEHDRVNGWTPKAGVELRRQIA